MSGACDGPEKVASGYHDSPSFQWTRSRIALFTGQLDASTCCAARAGAGELCLLFVSRLCALPLAQLSSGGRASWRVTKWHDPTSRVCLSLGSLSLLDRECCPAVCERPLDVSPEHRSAICATACFTGLKVVLSRGRDSDVNNAYSKIQGREAIRRLTTDRAGRRAFDGQVPTFDRQIPNLNSVMRRDPLQLT